MEKKRSISVIDNNGNETILPDLVMVKDIIFDENVALVHENIFRNIKPIIDLQKKVEERIKQPENAKLNKWADLLGNHEKNYQTIGVDTIIHQELKNYNLEQVKTYLTAVDLLNMPVLLNAVARYAVISYDKKEIKKVIRETDLSLNVITHIKKHRKLKRESYLKSTKLGKSVIVERSIADCIKDKLFFKDFLFHREKINKIVNTYGGERCVYISDKNLTSLQGIDQLPKDINRLDLSSNYILGPLFDLHFLPRPFNAFSQLTVLCLCHNWLLKELPVNIFEGLGNLKELYLNAIWLKKIPKGLFKPLKKLEFLNLRTNKLKKLKRGMFAGLGELKTLFLGHNRIKEIRKRSFEDLKKLELLEIDNNRPLEEIPVKAIKRLSSLKELDLTDNFFEEKSKQKMRKFCKEKNIELRV